VPAASSRRRVLRRSFYEGDSLEVAPLLLNKILARRDDSGVVTVSGRIVEVEAYRGETDPASHAYRGPTKRNGVMFGPPGHLYVYFTYGMHWCANVVCAPEAVARAVLLRALAPVDGLELIRANRLAGLADTDLLSGPARLCQGLGIDRRFDGADLVTGDLGFVLLDDRVPPPDDPGTSGRVGIREAADLPWRFWVPGDPNVSRARYARPGGPKPAGRRTSRTTADG
jgi:DNA-3-methyladenine glycosylase